MAAGSLEGKVAIVTGAAMGMGEATARVFAAAGARVLVSDINEKLGLATAERIERAGGTASFCRTDVSRAADAENMVRTAVERYGRSTARSTTQRSPRTPTRSSSSTRRSSTVSSQSI